MFRLQPFLGVSPAKAKQGRVNSLGLASLNNFGGLWTTGVVPSCLAPGPGMIQAGEYCWGRGEGVGTGQAEEVWL